MNNEKLRRVWAWCRSTATCRAWSRAGAIAAVLGCGAPRRVVGWGARIALLLAGSMTIASAVAVMLWNELGPGPLDVFIGAIRSATGLPLAIAVWGVVGSLIAIAWALGRRPGLGTIASPLLVGPTMQVVLAQLERAEPASSFVVRTAVHLLAIGAVGIGAGLLLASGLGAGTGELLASATSDQLGRQEPVVRFGFEVTWLVVGVALGGPFGVGTVLVAAGIGPAVAYGSRLVDAALLRSRRRLSLAFV